MKNPTLAVVVLGALCCGTVSAQVWSNTNPMLAARSLAGAAVLPSGKVLVVSGFSQFNPSNQFLTEVEIFNPATGTWSVTAPLPMAHFARGTVLKTGEVLVVGDDAYGNPSPTAYVYNETTAAWTATGPPSIARYGPASIVLPSGAVLMAGGYNGGCCSGLDATYFTAEIYNRGQNVWSPAASMSTRRAGHTGTLLPSGQFLVAGGFIRDPIAYHNTAELYDPASNIWSPTGTMANQRSSHTATLLPSGKVLVVGGDGVSDVTASAELYDPATGKWSATGSLNTARSRHTATLLASGKVLVTGGGNGNGPFNTAELYDPATGTWSPAGAMKDARTVHTASLLPDGRVLVAGGTGANGAPLASAEIFTPAVAQSTLVITSVFFPAAAEGSPYTFTFTASGGQPPYQWSANGLPSWLTLSAAGVLSGTPPKGSAGSVPYTVTVMDSAKNFISAPLTLKVNGAIAIAPTQLASATEATPYNATFTATGGTGSFSWSASGLPAWLTLSSSGVLSGTPPLGSAANYQLSIKATDSAGASATLSITLTVNPVPVIITTKSPLPAATENAAYTAQLNASGGKTPYQWSGTGLPSWLTLSAAGTLSGTPPPRSAGSIGFTATVTDFLGVRQSTAFVLPINAASGALTVTSPAQLPQGTVGSYYTQKLTASGGTPPYNWAEAFTPAGITLSSSGVISGTPSSSGDFAFSSRVSDSKGASAFKLFSLTVAPIPFAITTTAPLADGVVGVPYSQTFSATGGKAPIAWSSDALPMGLSLTPAGVLAGTPAAAGSFTTTVSAKDAAGLVRATKFQLNIGQPGGLALSSGSLAFNAIASGGNPPPQNLTVISTASGPAGPLAVSFSASKDAPWLSLVPGSGTTPGSIDVSVNPGAMPPGNYAGNITISSPNLPTKNVPVSLSLVAAPASLSVSPAELHLFTSKSTAAPVTASLQLRNTGSGAVAFTTNVVATLPDGTEFALTASPSSGTVNPNATVAVGLSIDTRPLAPGYYRGRVEVNWGGGSTSALVTLLVGAKPELFMSANGVTINATQGAGLAGPAIQSFTLLGSDATPINYSVKLNSVSPWLSLGTAGGTATNSSPGTVSFTVDPTRVDPASQVHGAAYGRIQVTSPDVFNSPQDFIVVLNVNPPDVPVPSLFPAGLLFKAIGGAAPASQTFQVFTNTPAAVPLQVGASTEVGSWLSAKASAPTVSGGSPAVVTVSVNPAGLNRGFYRGKINVSENSPVVRSVSVLLVVTVPVPGNSPNATATLPASCTAASIAVTQTALEGNFFIAAGWPGTVTASVVDDCGNAVSNAAVTANFSNGDAPVTLGPANSPTGKYSQNWYPAFPAAQVTVNITATVPGLDPATAQIGGGAKPNDVPMLRGDGPLHIFNPQTAAALAPGTLLQIYGSGLAAASPIVDIGGYSTPILYAGDSQINTQVPFELPTGDYQLIVSVGPAVTDIRKLVVSSVTPGVAALSDGTVIAQHAITNYPYVTQDFPAKPGDYLVVYLAGMGLTSPLVATGANSPFSPLATVPFPAVTIDGVTATVVFTGMSPGIVGVYQINILVPSLNKLPGDPRAVQLQIVQNGVPANSSLLWVQP